MAHNRDKAQRIGRELCATLKEKLGRQMFEVVIQASANNKVVARETLKVCPSPSVATSCNTLEVVVVFPCPV